MNIQFNTPEKSSTGVSPADLVITNAIHMQTNLYSPTDSAKAIETSTPIREVLDKMIAWQSILLKVAQKTQSALDSHRIAQHDPNYTDYPINSNVLYTAPTVTGPSDKDRIKMSTNLIVSIRYKIWLMGSLLQPISTTYVNSTMIQTELLQ